jgi:hypothetical protein
MREHQERKNDTELTMQNAGLVMQKLNLKRRKKHSRMIIQRSKRIQRHFLHKKEVSEISDTFLKHDLIFIIFDADS